MKKTLSIIITITLVTGIGFLFFGQSKKAPDSPSSIQPTQNSEKKAVIPPAQNVEIRDGVQYITINARGGYSPKVSTAEANIPTKLVIKTNGTYDCSASLVIKSIGYQKILPQTGEEIIDLNTPQTGTLQGLCSMGMYNFTVNFK